MLITINYNKLKKRNPIAFWHLGIWFNWNTPQASTFNTKWHLWNLSDLYTIVQQGVLEASGPAIETV